MASFRIHGKRRLHVKESGLLRAPFGRHFRYGISDNLDQDANVKHSISTQLRTGLSAMSLPRLIVTTGATF
jgi:hypothetical protein